MTQESQYKIIKNEYAQVTSVTHPLVIAKGFTNINTGEMIVFEDDSLGQVLSYDETELKLMVFSKNPVAVGSKLYRTKLQLSFPISNKIMGSVCNPLGEILIAAIPTKTTNSTNTTNKTPLPTKVVYRELYKAPPAIIKRKRIEDQLSTGFGITDLLLPIGQGQRELLIGDKKSGKANFARKLAVQQAQNGNKVVFAMVAEKVTDIKKNYDFFIKNKVMNSIVIIASNPKDPISSIVITPFSGMTVAEELRDNGHNVLLIIDDLTSQAEFYREISLLAKKFPGRDSYPGDVFFSHAQLLERAGSYINPTNPDAKKAISITCLPIVRTTNNDLTDFIASNLISITDGHLLFDQSLFSQGIRPAVDLGLSVTRVGKQTQTQLQRDINLKVTSFLSNYKKTKNLTHLGSEISESSQNILTKGNLLTKFFSESESIYLSVQIILIAIIWLDWFKNAHKKVIDSCKVELTKNYADNTIKQQIDNIILSSNSFNELLTNVQKNKVLLLGICKV